MRHNISKRTFPILAMMFCVLVVAACGEQSFNTLNEGSDSNSNPNVTDIGSEGDFVSNIQKVQNRFPVKDMSSSYLANLPPSMKKSVDSSARVQSSDSRSDYERV